MSFVSTVVRSIYAPDFYAAIPQAAFRSALDYFLLLSLLLTAINTAALAVPVLTTLSPDLEEIVRILDRSYPAGLVIRIHNAQVSTNVPEPFLLALSSDTQNSSVTNNLIKGQTQPAAHLLVIDTSAPFDTARFAPYRTLAWPGRSSISVKMNGSEIRTDDLSSISDDTVGNARVDSWAVAISPWLPLVGPILVAFAIPTFYLLYSLRLVYLLALTLLIWPLSRILGWRLTYGQSYKVGLFAMTAAFLVTLAINLTQSWLHLAGFPFTFSLITLVVISVNIVSAGGSPGIGS